MKERIVIEEILDSLPEDDPRAIRSRRDLRLINAVMGNYRWIKRQLRRQPDISSWTEIGAGSGELGKRVKGASIRGVDFLSRPDSWPKDWPWHEGDLFGFFEQKDPSSRPEGLLANLFLHHFEEDSLRVLGGHINEQFSCLVISEPARYSIFKHLSAVFFPFVNEVTQHDMVVSIGAGFRQGELPEALGLDADWQIHETVSLLGAYRMTAWRQ
ncbi:MAG: hypothetical protein P1U87_12165 [Verrucomicrobiales bacterium]|nr:hypothetical protein [Verrucomicrobiales bacterium]